MLRVQHLAEARGFKNMTYMSRELRRLFGCTRTQTHGQGGVPIHTLVPGVN